MFAGIAVVLLIGAVELQQSCIVGTEPLRVPGEVLSDSAAQEVAGLLDDFLLRFLRFFSHTSVLS